MPSGCQAGHRSGGKESFGSDTWNAAEERGVCDGYVLRRSEHAGVDMKERRFRLNSELAISVCGLTPIECLWPQDHGDRMRRPALFEKVICGSRETANSRMRRNSD